MDRRLSQSRPRFSLSTLPTPRGKERVGWVGRKARQALSQKGAEGRQSSMPNGLRQCPMGQDHRRPVGANPSAPSHQSLKADQRSVTERIRARHTRPGQHARQFVSDHSFLVGEGNIGNSPIKRGEGEAVPLELPPSPGEKPPLEEKPKGKTSLRGKTPY